MLEAVLTGILLGLAVGMAGCGSTKADLQRSDVEQMYRDGRIDRITYADMMQKIADKEAAEHAASVEKSKALPTSHRLERAGSAPSGADALLTADSGRPYAVLDPQSGYT